MAVIKVIPEKLKNFSGRLMNVSLGVIKWLAERYIYISLFCFSIPLVYYSLTYFMGDGFGLLRYMSTSYAVNYFDYGFTKRGFIGTLIWWIPVHEYEFIALFFSIFCFAILIIFFHRFVCHIQDALTRNLLKVLFALSPFTAFQFGYEVGRLDVFNVLILMIALYYAHKEKYLLVFLLSICGILIHEAFAAFGIPLIIASLLKQFEHKKFNERAVDYLFIAVYCVSCAIVSMLIIKYGNSDLVVKLTPGSGQQAWSRPLVQHGLAELGWINIFLTTVVICATYAWLVAFYKFNKGNLDILFFAALGPLALLFLGWDYARWCALIFIVVLSVIFIKAIVEKWSLNFSIMKFGGGFLLLPFGPIGYMNFFPLIRTSIKMVDKVF